MKGVVLKMRKIAKVLFIISILIVLFVILSNLLIFVRILFFGMKVGSDDYPDSIWWGERELIGVAGVKTYYSVWGQVMLILAAITCLPCILYQVIYLIVTKKK